MNYLSDAEIWKPIPGYEGLYDASNLGRIRSHPGRVVINKNGVARKWPSKIIHGGYCGSRKDMQVGLSVNGKTNHCIAARLVAMAWHGVPREYMTVNHINGNHFDNRAENLEWLPLAENIRHGYDNGLFASTCKPVILVDTFGNSRKFRSTIKASEFLNRCPSYVKHFIAKGKKFVAADDGTKYRIVLGGDP